MTNLSRQPPPHHNATIYFTTTPSPNLLIFTTLTFLFFLYRLLFPPITSPPHPTPHHSTSPIHITQCPITYMYILSKFHTIGWALLNYIKTTILFSGRPQKTQKNNQNPAQNLKNWFLLNFPTPFPSHLEVPPHQLPLPR